MAEEVIVQFVGNADDYKRMVDALNGSIEQTGEEVDDVNEKGTKGAGELKDAYSEVTGVVDGLLGGMVSKGRAAYTTIQKVTGATKLFGKAWIATGIGAIVVLIASLVAHLTSTEDGMNKVTKVTDQLGAALRVVIDRGAQMASGLWKVITGDFKAGFEELKASISGIGDELQKEIKTAGDVADTLADIRKQERALEVDRAQTNAEISRLRSIAIDAENYSTQQRIAALQEANQIEEELATREVELAQRRVEALTLAGTLAENSAEENQELANAQIRLAELERGSIDRKREMISQVVTLRREEQALADARKKSTEEFREEIKAMEEEAELWEEEHGMDDFEYIYEELENRERIEREARDKRIALEEEEAQIKEQIAEQSARRRSEVMQAQAAVGITVLQSMMAVADQESGFGKGLAVAMATINTYQAATNALANTPLPPPFPQIAAGAVLAAGFAQVRNILSTPVPARRGGTQTGGSRPVASRGPSISVLGSGQGSNPIERSLSRRDDRTSRAQVVASEVEDGLALERRTRRTATLFPG